MSMNPPVAPAAKGPNWMLLGGVAAGALGLIMWSMKNNSGAPATTAAGTSINAALGSLQEEQLNTQGAVGALQQSLGLPTNMTLTDVLTQNQTSLFESLDQEQKNSAAQTQTQEQNLYSLLAQQIYAYYANLLGLGQGISGQIAAQAPPAPAPSGQQTGMNTGGGMAGSSFSDPTQSGTPGHTVSAVTGTY